MNWWYTHVFLDRTTPITREVVQNKQPIKVQNQDNQNDLLKSALNWLTTKYQEQAQLRYDWRIYKNLTDHQLKDIGLTRYDLHLLLKNKTPVLPQQRLHTVKPVQAPHQHPQLIRDTDLNKPDVESCHEVCSNDFGTKAA